MIAGLKPYPTYKDSSVPWLGEVPEHWELHRTKTLLRERSEKGFPDEPLLAATQTKGVVRKEQYEYRTVLALKDLHLLKLVRSGDFVISLRSFQGGIEYAREQGIISPAYTILYPNDQHMHGFLAWLFKSRPYIENLTLHVTGIRQGQNIDYERLSRSELPVPPASEQTAIARFLDHVDRRIRHYIAAKKKLVALLNEQKQAIIHRTVTRGLDPNVRLRLSGVDWLGQVPEHWEVSALRHRYDTELGKMLDAKRITGQSLVPYLRNVDVQWDTINTQDLPMMDIAPHEHSRYTLRPGDLLVCEGGEVGRCAFWNGELALCGFQKALHRVMPLDLSRDAPRFLFYVMYTAAKLGVFAAGGSENTIAHLTGVKLRGHRFAFPPWGEQQTIAAHLDRTVTSVGRAMARAGAEIGLIREYRAHLIADVVTGKLDVRQAAARLPEETGKREPLDEGEGLDGSDDLEQDVETPGDDKEDENDGD